MTPGPVVRTVRRPGLAGAIPVARPVGPFRPGSITVGRVVDRRPAGSLAASPSTACPAAGSITVSRPVVRRDVASISVARPVTPRGPGALSQPVVVRYRGAGTIAVPRARRRLPAAGSLPVGTHGATVAPGELGPGELGTISLDDRVVEQIASRAASEHPDAGAVATRVLGANVPGLGRSTSLEESPKTTVDVDGARAWVGLDLSVRYPAPIAATTQAVRERIRERVAILTGVEVAEVDVTVKALVTDLPAAPRVR